MSISIIIPTRNRIESLVRCVRSIVAQSQLPDELIIVDSSDQSMRVDQKFKQILNLCAVSRIELIFSYGARGASYQRNVGIHLAHGDFLYFFDDDVVLHRDYLKRMQETFLCYPSYYGGTGTFAKVNTGFTLNRLVRIIFFMQRENSSGEATISGMPTHPYGKGMLVTTQVLGGCAGFRAQVFDEFFFDERLGLYSYMEDFDLSFRISRKYQLFYNPLAILEHLHCPLARNNVCDNRAIYIYNYSYLFFKNFYPMAKLKVFAYFWTIIGLFIEALLARNGDYLRGYVRGLKNYWLRRSFPENGL